MGRGNDYTWWRKAGEAAEALFYANGWAARAAYALGLQGRLRVDRLGLPRGAAHRSSSARCGRADDRCVRAAHPATGWGFRFAASPACLVAGGPARRTACPGRHVRCLRQTRQAGVGCVAWPRVQGARALPVRRPACRSASRLHRAARTSPLYSTANSAMMASATPAPSNH